MKKLKPKSGDLFRFLITHGDDNDGFFVYGYGRVLNNTTVAMYSNNALPPRKKGVTPSVNEILNLDVAFVVGCSFDGYESNIYEVIENVELEEKFKEPYFFYHRSVASDTCSIFNIWDSSVTQNVHISEVPVGVERWACYGHSHMELRLGIPPRGSNT